MIHAIALAQTAQPNSFINHIDNFWIVLLLKAAMVLIFFLVAPLAVERVPRISPENPGSSKRLRRASAK